MVSLKPIIVGLFFPVLAQMYSKLLVQLGPELLGSVLHFSDFFEHVPDKLVACRSLLLHCVEERQ
jgi:hypothetical protein